MTLMQHKLKQKSVVIHDDNSENATILEMLLSMGNTYILTTTHKSLC
ncbi:MAG TPA: hypothetical protein VN729_11625 [Ktedonobacteraceae bacterium]|nr:hypothetical protein [Ktedonobacteraceae bacterium]